MVVLVVGWSGAAGHRIGSCVVDELVQDTAGWIVASYAVAQTLPPPSLGTDWLPRFEARRSLSGLHGLIITILKVFNIKLNKACYRIN